MYYFLYFLLEADIILLWRLFLIFELKGDGRENSEGCTWSDAVHHSNEGISIPPAGTEVVDLYSQLLGDLCLYPLEKSFLGANLPLLLGLPIDAPLSQGAVIVSAACVSSPTARTGETLAELLQNPSVLLDLEIFLSTLFFL